MQGLFASRRGLTIYLLVWLFIGVALGAVVSLLGAAPWLNGQLFAVPVSLLFGGAAGYSAYYLCRAYPLGSARAAAIPLVFSGAALAAGLLWLTLAQAWNSVCQLLAVSWAGVVLLPLLSALMVGLGMLLYGFAAALHYVVIEFLRASGAEQRSLEARLMAQDAELRMLRTQIDPHFLFNSLNSISALTSQDASAARRMTLELASFFRQSLGMEAHTRVTLQEELVLIRHFLAIEQVRFGARLQVEELVAADAMQCLVPPMIIQPLVENAVKHGIGNLPDGGCVRIYVERAATQLQIRIENGVDADLPAPRATGKGSGIGLANVRQRLAAAYQHEASIHWARLGDSFQVEILMPAQTGEA